MALIANYQIKVKPLQFLKTSHKHLVGHDQDWGRVGPLQVLSHPLSRHARVHPEGADPLRPQPLGELALPVLD